MGILDDAIREHLDLKRKHGAEQEDIERLEKEAFGPPERPGDEDASGEQGAAAATEQRMGFEGPSAEGAVTDGGSEVSEEYDWLGDLGDEGLEDLEDLEGSGEAGLEAGWRPGSEGAVSDAEKGRADHPDLGDTLDHPVPRPEPSTGEEEPSFGEERSTGEEPSTGDELSTGEGPEPPEAGIFDAAEEDLRVEDLDLDLELEGEGEGEGRTPSGETFGEGGDEFEFDVAEPSAEEHPLPGGSGRDRGEDADPGTSEAAGYEEDEDEDDYEEGTEEGDDLLEETPDFLQDAPEGERLWFEQRGKPKDFDFDD